jgi:hypothetical protein
MMMVKMMKTERSSSSNGSSSNSSSNVKFGKKLSENNPRFAFLHILGLQTNRVTCMYVCKHACMYVFIYVYVRMHACMYVCVLVCASPYLDWTTNVSAKELTSFLTIHVNVIPLATTPNWHAGPLFTFTSLPSTIPTQMSCEFPGAGPTLALLV